LFTTALKASAIKTSALTTTFNVSAFKTVLGSSAEHSVLRLCSKINFINMDFGADFMQNTKADSFFSSKYFENTKRYTPADRTDIQLNFE
jgi:hypothetical protein